MFSSFNSTHCLSENQQYRYTFLWNFENVTGNTIIPAIVGNGNLILSNPSAISSASKIGSYCFTGGDEQYNAKLTFLNRISTSRGISVSCWVKMNNTSSKSSIRTVFGLSLNATWTGGTDIFYVHLASNATTIFECWGCGSYVYSSATTINNGSWHHMVVIYVGTLFTMYFDNSPVINNATIGTLTPNLKLLALNLRPDGAEPGVFSIDNFRIYDYVLTSSEITALYNGGIGI